MWCVRRQLTASKQTLELKDDLLLLTAAAVLEPMTAQAVEACVALTGAGAAYVALVEDPAPPGLRPLAAAAERPADADEGAGDEPEDAPAEDDDAGADGAGVVRPPARMLQVHGPLNFSVQVYQNHIGCYG